MKKTLLAISGTIALGMIAIPAQAAIVGVGNGGRIISAPDSVFDDAPGVEDADEMLGFDERQNVLLTDDLQVDNGFIAAGTRVNSHMILLNTPGSGWTTLEDIEWTFNGRILGVMSDFNGTLEAASNSILGAPGTAYPGSFRGRGLGGGSPIDTHSGVGTNTLTVTMRVREPGDWIRVVTAVPEPLTILGSATALGFGALFKREHSKKQKKAK